MVRINLLPAEILERRRWERYYPWVFLVGGVLLVILLATWGFQQLLIAQANAELQQTKQNVTNLQAQAEAFKVFELKEAELNQRAQVAASARAAEIDMGVLAEEISLVLPEEMWVEKLVLNELTGAQLTAWTPDTVVGKYSPGTQVTSLQNGYKSIAAMLVRLNSLDRLFDVWLVKAETASYQFDVEGGQKQAIRLDATSKISTATPAPPSASSGQ